MLPGIVFFPLGLNSFPVTDLQQLFFLSPLPKPPVLPPASSHRVLLLFISLNKIKVIPTDNKYMKSY